MFSALLPIADMPVAFMSPRPSLLLFFPGVWLFFCVVESIVNTVMAACIWAMENDYRRFSSPYYGFCGGFLIVRSGAFHSGREWKLFI